MAILPRGGSHQSFQLHHLALAAQLLYDPLTGRLSDPHVIGADEAGVLVAQDGPVQDDHRDARVDCPGHRLGERGGLFGADDDQVDAGGDELLDVGPLLERVVLGVLEDGLEPVGVLLGGGLDVGVHLHAPRLAQVALAHADDPGILGCTGVPFPRLRRAADARQHTEK